MRHDERLGHRFIADVNVRVAHESGAFYVRTNAQGFRNDGDFGAKGDALRVAFYGDSFTAGDGVSNAERFSDLAARQLGFEGLNLAASGHGPDQTTLLFEDTPVDDADLVILCIAVNTIDRIQRGRRIAMDRHGRHLSVPRPHFALENGELQVRGVPVIDEQQVLHEVTLPAIESPLAARLGLLTAALRQRISPLVRGVLPRRDDSEYDDPEGDGWKLMAAIIERFHGLGACRG